MKKQKEEFSTMIDRCAWAIIEGLIHGRTPRVIAIDVFNITLGWQREHGKLKS